MMKAGKRATIVGVSIKGNNKNIHNFDGSDKEKRGVYEVTCPLEGKVIKFPFKSRKEFEEIVEITRIIKREMIEEIYRNYRIAC
jgi:1,4-alpha-glucan branching enzyme